MLPVMKLSVVVCTYNRAAYLGRMLESFYAQRCLEALEFELLVIDNNSTDSTPEVAAEFQGRSGFRYLQEPVRGLSHARNRGLREARGTHIAYLDDDVLLMPDWARHLLQCFEETGADAVGGKSLLRFEQAPPPWFGKELAKLLSEVDLGDTRLDAGDGRRLYGLNLAFRSTALRDAGGFDTALGRSGGALTSGEDLRATAAVVAAGGKAYYEPRALVYHCIPPERTEWNYLLKLAESGARTRAQLDRGRGWGVLVRGMAEALFKLLLLRTSQWFSRGQGPDGEAVRARSIAVHRLQRLVRGYFSLLLRSRSI